MQDHSAIARIMRSDIGIRWFVGVLVAAAVLLPLAHILFPKGSPLHVSTYTLGLVGKYMTYALLAVAIDLIWGYCGILSLGHTAWRLCHGNVSDAPDRHARCLRGSRAA